MRHSKVGIRSGALIVLSRLFLYLWCAFSVFSFFWIISTSLKTNREYFAKVWGLPELPRWANYAKVLGEYHLGLNFINSLIIVAVSVTVIILVSTPAAYILSRFKFKGVGFLNRFFTLGMGVPFQLLLIPLFFILYRLKLVGSYAGLIIVYVSLSIPFTIFLIQGFFRTLPSVLEEAAYIDGCSPIGTFFSIMLPIGSPGIVTAAIFNFISLWNEFLLALTLLNDSRTYTLSIGLYALQGAMQYTGDWVALFAAIVVVTIPTLIVYLLLSRQIIEGLTMGAVKE
jgi:raffinose/stachyose/melibiose transport system permease protein/N-acetylglucosamine transport system permease protein